MLFLYPLQRPELQSQISSLQGDSPNIQKPTTPQQYTPVDSARTLWYLGRSVKSFCCHSHWKGTTKFRCFSCRSILLHPAELGNNLEVSRVQVFVSGVNGQTKAFQLVSIPAMWGKSAWQVRYPSAKQPWTLRSRARSIPMRMRTWQCGYGMRQGFLNQETYRKKLPSNWNIQAAFSI